MANPWLARQRKSDLVDLAEDVGLQNYEGLKKNDLELSLDEFLSGNATQFSGNPKLAQYFQSRAKAIGSPIKKEAPELKVPKRRAASKPVEDTIVTLGDRVESEEDPEPIRAASTALARTPGRALALAQRIPLPASPADVAELADRSTVAIRRRAASIYAESRIPEATNTTRETLSTVTAILFLINGFELLMVKREILPNRYAFTFPAIHALGTPEYPVNITDMFLLLTASFWQPALTWIFTSALVPTLFGYFFNLSHASRQQQVVAGGPATRARARAAQPEYVVDPLTFSIVKAVLTYVVYAQGVTFNGWIDDVSVARINSALYGGWKGAIAGSAIVGLVSIYDAILRK